MPEKAAGQGPMPDTRPFRGAGTLNDRVDRVAWQEAPCLRLTDRPGTQAHPRRAYGEKSILDVGIGTAGCIWQGKPLQERIVVFDFPPSHPPGP
jgi:hypothetical protein